MSAGVFWWWFFLCAVGGLNILAWSLSAGYLRRRRAVLCAEEYASRRLQLLLSAGYVFGCAFRSVMPVYDVGRVCLFDSWLCSVIIGRSVATFAELCFAAQWALLLRDISRATGSGVGRVTAKVMVPLIAVAEMCSWYSVLTTSNLGHVVEESIWALSAGLLVMSLLWIWPRCSASLRPLLAAWCAAGIAYVAFMFLIDVPMYETLAAFVLLEHLQGESYEPARGEIGYHRVMSARGRRIYSAKDGYIAMTPYSGAQWAQFFRETGRAELADDPRITDAVFAVLGVEKSVRSRTSYGGTAPANVKKQAKIWLKKLG